MATPPIEKDPSDALPVTMNFGNMPEIIGGDTITSCAIAASPLSGSTGTLGCSAVTVNGPKCTSIFTGGTADSDYAVRFTASLTAGGNDTYTYVRVLGGIVQVRSEPQEV